MDGWVGTVRRRAKGCVSPLQGGVSGGDGVERLGKGLEGR